MRFEIVLSVVGLLLTTASGAKEQDVVRVGSPGPNWTLKDINDHEYKLTDYHGKPLLIMGSDKEGQTDNAYWGEKIREKYNGRIPSVGVADLRSVPGLFRGAARYEIRNRKKTNGDKNVPLILDWNGTLCRPYRFRPGVSRIVLLDAQGIVRYAGYGKYTDEEFKVLASAIDALLAAPAH